MQAGGSNLQDGTWAKSKCVPPKATVQKELLMAADESAPEYKHHDKAEEQKDEEWWNIKKAGLAARKTE